MGEVFYWIFNMSIASAVVGTAILLLRSIKKIPRRVITYLWMIPILRMWIPVGISGRYGLMSFLSHFTTKTVVVYEMGKDASLSYTNFVMAADSYSPITYKINLLEKVFDIAAVVWLVVALALLLAFGIIYVITLREIKDSLHLKDRIYLSDKIQSPAVYGVFRPRIILPSAYKDEELSFVLLHEREHIKSFDNLRRLIAFATTAVHWFNPLVWIFLRCYLSDLELSCDEKVLSSCGEEQKKGYALSLLKYAESKNVFASAFGGANIRLRIENILSYNKMSVVSLIGFVALIIVIAYVLLTNAL